MLLRLFLKKVLNNSTLLVDFLTFIALIFAINLISCLINFSLILIDSFFILSTQKKVKSFLFKIEVLSNNLMNLHGSEI